MSTSYLTGDAASPKAFSEDGRAVLRVVVARLGDGRKVALAVESGYGEWKRGPWVSCSEVNDDGACTYLAWLSPMWASADADSGSGPALRLGPVSSGRVLIRLRGLPANWKEKIPPADSK